MDAFVRAATLKHYIEVAQTLALNPGEMLRDVGLLPTLLDDPESLLPLDARPLACAWHKRGACRISEWSVCCSAISARYGTCC